MTTNLERLAAAVDQFPSQGTVLIDGDDLRALVLLAEWAVYEHRWMVCCASSDCRERPPWRYHCRCGVENCALARAGERLLSEQPGPALRSVTPRSEDEDE